MSDDQTPQEPNPKGFVTNEILELKLKKQFADLRLIIIASVALNQFLMNVQLPTAVSFVAIGTAIVAPALKVVFGIFGGRS